MSSTPIPTSPKNTDTSLYRPITVNDVSPHNADPCRSVESCTHDYKVQTNDVIGIVDETT